MINIRKEAYLIIKKVLSKNIFSDKLLKQMTKKLHSAGENADLLYFMVKGVIKMQKNLEFIASQFTDSKKFCKTDDKIKYLLYLGLYQMRYSDNIPEHAAVNETVNLAKELYNQKIANFVNAVLRSYQKSPIINYPQKTSERLSLEYSFPQKMVKAWIENWGEDRAEEFCMYSNDVPQLHVRNNRLAQQKSELMRYFNDRSILFKESEFSSDVLISNQARKILNDPALEAGKYSIQDSSAALVIELMQPQKNASVLDLFAAPGGKTSYIAERMENSGEIIAVDKIPNKTKKIKRAIRRLQLKNVKTITEDAFKYGPIAPAYDFVLLDVPCSGWGVLQKKAELRWQKNQDIKEILKLQRNALKRGAEFVRPGGFLIYSTCTLNEEENEKMVSDFLEKNKNFNLIPANKHLSKEITKNGFLKTLPFLHNMDGAFAAKLQKED